MALSCHTWSSYSSRWGLLVADKPTATFILSVTMQIVHPSNIPYGELLAIHALTHDTWVPIERRSTTEPSKYVFVCA